jgi:hypothetical protein
MSKSVQLGRRPSAQKAKLVQRALKCYAALDKAWGQDNWKPPDEFMLEKDGRPVSRPRTMSWPVVWALHNVTENARKQDPDVDLLSFWSPGGLLHSTMAEENPEMPRWTSHTAKKAWEKVKHRDIDHDDESADGSGVADISGVEDQDEESEELPLDVTELSEMGRHYE